MIHITERYIIYEKIGEKYYRIPTIYSFEEYWQMRNRQAENEYFRRRANTTSYLKPKQIYQTKIITYR